jgi:uncharacterized protein (TIGR03083 family)
VEYPLNQAMQSTLAVLTKVRPGDLDAPTPCASWDVRALVNHFVGTARWWAATIDGDGEVADADYTAGDYVAACGAGRPADRLPRPLGVSRARCGAEVSWLQPVPDAPVTSDSVVR